MCRAIQASDNDSVQLLWQCGRSVTLTCVSGGDKTYLLQRSLMASEDYQTASELTDTWSHWAAKVNQLLSTSSKKPAEQEKFLKARDISFRGAQASKALVNGIVAMRRFSAECLEGLKMIDKEFGVAVFNSGYVKLVRLSQIAASLPAEASLFQKPGVTDSHGLIANFVPKSQLNRTQIIGFEFLHGLPGDRRCPFVGASCGLCGIEA